MSAAVPEGRSAVAASDLAAVQRQLGRPARGVAEVAHRCPCGEPDVLRTEPRLPDGSPFPTTYYATCPRLTGAVSTLETAGVMREMTERLGRDDDLAAAYAAAHEHYLVRRAELGVVAEIEGVSAGGMPTRVKCLHVLVAHSLAAGPGVNPLGDEALAMLDDWWRPTSCAALHAVEDAAGSTSDTSTSMADDSIDDDHG
jgi:hypothetical protein